MSAQADRAPNVEDVTTVDKDLSTGCTHELTGRRSCYAASLSSFFVVTLNTGQIRFIQHGIGVHRMYTTSTV